MAEIKSKVNNGELTIFASGRIDSTNAGDVEVKVKNAVSENEHSTVVLDLENLEYLSSAGLRVVLRLRKDEPSLKIINASSEVYEIFDMTGFTEMMTIEKAYRRVSIDGCEVIGQGANGKVYRIDADTIVKYYFNSDALPDIHRERELARKAFVLGIPTAIPYDVVKVGDGYGSVFELLNALSFLKLIKAEPENIDKYVGYSVDVLKKMHATSVNPDDMPNQRERALQWVDVVYDCLPKDKAEKLKAFMESIPESDKMMHGDYHIKNIMMQNGEVLLIDMDTLCYGDSIFEFAGMYNAYNGFADLNPDNSMEFFGIEDSVARYIWKKTLEMYFNTTDKDLLTNLENKIKVVAYTKLLRRTIKKKRSNEELEFYKSKVLEFIDKVDSLVL